MNTRFGASLIACTAISIPALAGTQANYLQLVKQAPTVTTVQTSTPSTLAGAPVVLTVGVVASNGTPIPSGTVVLTDGTNAPSSAFLVDGTASITQNLSSIGTRQISACYLGGGNFVASCSLPLSLSSLPPYVLKQATQSAAVTPFTPFTDQLTIVPTQGYVGTVQLSCQAKLEYYQCAVSPSSVALVGRGEPEIVSATFIPYVPWSAGSFIALPLIGILGVKSRRKRLLSRIFSVLTAATVLAGLAGCGSGITGPYMPTRPGSYTMVVSAISGNYSQSVTYQMAVK